MDLKDFFSLHPKLALAFSGGADSALALYSAVSAGAEIKAYYLKSPFQPEFELADARRLAGELGVPLEVVPMDALAVPGIADNPADRCCLCKRAMFSCLLARAAADGFDTLADGTNASDCAEDRPGMRALRELGVLSPLRECGISKAQVRLLSRQAGLFTWDKPAYSCLATRVGQGEPITLPLLDRIQQAETALFDLGFSDLRVRVSGGAARLQLTDSQLARGFELKNDIIDRLGPLFDSVALDLEPREASV